MLDALAKRLHEYSPEAHRRHHAHLSSGSAKSGWLSAWSSAPRAVKLTEAVPPKGVYMFGDVGSGKTMCVHVNTLWHCSDTRLMDLFLDALCATPSPYEHRRNRVHFNSFMVDVHHRVLVL